MNSLDYKGLIFISGKGGTGKTTFSLYLSQMLAAQGRKVLMVELASRSAAESLMSIKIPGLGYEPQATPFGFDLCLLQGVDCLIDYVGSVMGVEKIARKIFETSLIRSLVNVAPGLNDLALLGKLTSHLRGHGPAFQYDNIIVDAPSTGSFQSLVSAPQILGESVKSGPLRTQSENIETALRNPDWVQYLFMGLFDEFAMDELEDTLSYFHKGREEQISLVINKSLALDKVQNEDSSWGSFLSSRWKEEERQSQRVQQLWDSSYSLALFTGSLKEAMQSSGGLLRKI